MISYQKVYTDHVHSSTIMRQLTQLWKNNLMCDAEILVGSSVIKAHRLVLVASCAILQSHENVQPGSMLEVTLPDDIKPESIYSFLEFLYQGHMILSEDNVKPIERIARLLHVEEILKCCKDFEIAIKSKNSEEHQGKFNFFDLAGPNHVRVTEFIKTVSGCASNKMQDDEVQRSMNGFSNSSEHADITQRSKSSVSFVTSPLVSERQKFSFGENESKRRIRTNSHTKHFELSSHHSIVDLSSDNHIRPVQLSPMDHHSDQTRSYQTETSTSDLTIKRRHSDQSRPNSTDNSLTNFSARSHDQYYRSLSDENVNQNNFKNSASVSFAAQYGFAMPVVPSALWTDKTMIQHLATQQDKTMIQHLTSQQDKSMVQHLTSQQNQNPRCSSNNSISSSASSKASTSQQVTRTSNDFSDLPICIDQDDSGDNRLVLDVSDIDLSMIKTENVEEPLDLHVEGAIQAAEQLSRLNKTERAASGQTTAGVTLMQNISGQRSTSSNQDHLETGHRSASSDQDHIVTGNRSASFNTDHVVTGHRSASCNQDHMASGLRSSTSNQEQYSTLQSDRREHSSSHGYHSDISKQWSAQLQSAMIKKKPVNLSSNVRKIIQDLNLNRRALASPAALGSLAVGSHKPVRMPGKNNYKVCSLCYRNKIRTKSGYYVYSYYKCSICDVPLCIGRRKCFLEYHKSMETPLIPKIEIDG